MSTMTHGDLPDSVLAEVRSGGRVAWDIETTGLDWLNDQIATCQIDAPEIGSFIVQLKPNITPRNLSSLLADETVLKVFHHAPFDLSFMLHAWSVHPKRVACTKVASKLLYDRESNASHSLQALLCDELQIRIDKEERLSNWAANMLTTAQLTYATNDVRYLLQLYDVLLRKIHASGKQSTYQACCDFPSTYCRLRILGKQDVFLY